MKKNKILTVLIVALVIIFLCGCVGQRRITTPEVFNVGYTIYDFSYSLKDNTIKTLTVAIWYPTSDVPEEYYYNENVVPGNVAVNGEVDKSGAPYPLVVFSHGLRSGGIGYTYFTQYLASHGYIVVAPDHEDAARTKIKGEKGDLPEVVLEKPFEEFPNRPADIKAIIDKMLELNNDPGANFYQTVDENAIGISGHSLGGWTTQVVSGAVPLGYEEYTDDRVKATLLLAPSTVFIEPEDYKKMNVPVMYLLGEFDLVCFDMETPRRLGYDNAKTPKFLPIVKGAGHITFGDNPTCLIYKTIENCQNSNPRVKVILKYGLAFLDRYLKNDLEAEKQLKIKDPQLKTYEYETE